MRHWYPVGHKQPIWCHLTIPRNWPDQMAGKVVSYGLSIGRTYMMNSAFWYLTVTIFRCTPRTHPIIHKNKTLIWVDYIWWNILHKIPHLKKASCQTQWTFINSWNCISKNSYFVKLIEKRNPFNSIILFLLHTLSNSWNHIETTRLPSLLWGSCIWKQFGNKLFPYHQDYLSIIAMNFFFTLLHGI